MTCSWLSNQVCLKPQSIWLSQCFSIKKKYRKSDLFVVGICSHSLKGLVDEGCDD